MPNERRVILPKLAMRMATVTLLVAWITGGGTLSDAVAAPLDAELLGGLWMSDNGGLTRTPLVEYQAVASMGAIAINQPNPDIIWVGTGEGNVRSSISIEGGDSCQRILHVSDTAGARIAVDAGLQPMPSP